MKIEISYKNSLIGSLSAGESLALHLNGQKLTEDLIVRAVADVVELPSLSAPTIEIADSILSIYDEEGLATSYDILVDGEVVATVNKVSLISFTIDGTEYQAESGMTWEDFVADTRYSNSNFSTIDTGSQISISHQTEAYESHYVATDGTSSNKVKASDDIIANYAYQCYVDNGGSGGAA